MAHRDDYTRTLILTALALICFAGNSLLCRLALRDTAIDAASFTAIRMVSGALALWVIVHLRGAPRHVAGNWISALALFAYAVTFSFAYVALTAGTGALILFGTVQATMIGYGVMRGERFSGVRLAGLVLAIGGLIGLLLPGLSAPPLLGAVLMTAAGVSWGVYSLRGRAAGDATQVTAGNFMRTVPFALALGIAMLPWARIDAAGITYAVASGAVTSGVGYAIWYTALRGLTPASAATVQLSVPLIAAAGGILLLHEALTLRLVLASITVLGGIALVIRPRARDSLASAPAGSDRG